MQATADLADCPFYLITRASLAITSRLKTVLASGGAGGVRPSYLPVLMSLWQEDDLRVSELSRRAGVEPSTMTTLLDRMERDGLVSRHADPDDRRAQRVQLMAAGATVREPAMAAVQQCFDEVLDGLTDERLEDMMGVLRAILRNTERGALP